MMSVIKNVELVPAAPDDLLRIENLLQFYLYDVSEWVPLAFDAKGQFFVQPKAEYWANPNTHAFLIRVDGELAGFATVDDEVLNADARYSIGYFFVARRFRGGGVGMMALRSLLARFPGIWEIYHVSANAGAQAFWQKAVPRLAADHHTVQACEIHAYPCTLYTFSYPPA